MRGVNNGHFKKGEHWRPHKPYWDREWLVKEYANKSSGDIAKEWGVTDATILFWLRKHKINRRTISEARDKKHWGCSGSKNPMYGICGKDNPNWRGGGSPARQAFYSSREWKEAKKITRERDGIKCKRCGSTKHLHYHHIIPFSHEQTRSDPNNLVLLCRLCHQYVHSRINITQEFIEEGGK